MVTGVRMDKEMKKKQKTKKQRLEELVALVKKHYAPQKKKDRQLNMFEATDERTERSD